MKTLNYLSILFLILLFSCRKDDVVVTPTPEPDPGPSGPRPALVNSKKISSTPFEDPRAAIVYQDKIYVVTPDETYSYDFMTNTWQLLIAYPFGSLANFYGISFIHNNNWYLKFGMNMWSFDFSTNTWTFEDNFSNVTVGLVKGIYYDDTLRFFAEYDTVIYNYAVDDKVLSVAGYTNPKGNSLNERAFYKVGNEFYYFNGTSTSSYISKWTNNFKNFDYLGNYRSNNISDCVGFVYQDFIIYGLGGEVYSNGSGSVKQHFMHDKFYYFNTSTKTFGKVDSSFYDTCVYGFGLEHDGKYYVLGGKKVVNDKFVARKSLDIVEFEIVE